MNNFEGFKFETIFHCVRGRRYKTEDHIPGDIAYISSTSKNNGVDAYVSPGDGMTIYENRLTLANSGSVGCCFFHPYKFVASDHVTVVWPKNRQLTKNIALFLKPILEKMQYRYSFGREITNSRLRQEIICLPVDARGEPDWDYMEQYISELILDVQFTSIKTKKKEPMELDLKGWKEWKIRDLFTLYTGKDLILYNVVQGDIPVVTHSAVNNGIEVFSEEIHGRKRFDCKRTISLADRGNFAAFVQDQDFYIGTRVKALELKEPYPSDRYVLLFLATMINFERFRFGYGRNATHRLPDLTLLLPQTADGSPDWDYMREFVKNQQYGEFLRAREVK